MSFPAAPFFSVIVPVFNTSIFLPKCVESILSQTFRDFELILVDDCSTDNSGQICDSYSYDNRVKIIHHSVNQGVVKARDTGIKNSKGKYIVWVDSDDYILSERLMVMFKVIREYNVDIVLTGNRILNKSKEKKVIDSIPIGVYHNQDYDRIRKSIMEFNRYKTNRNVSPCLWTKAIKRELFMDSTDKIPCSLKIGDDAPRVYLAFLAAKSLAVIKDYSYCYVHHHAQMTRSFPPDYFENALWIYEFIDEMNKEKGFLPERDLKPAIYQNICHITAYAACIEGVRNNLDQKARYMDFISHENVQKALKREFISSQNVFYRTVLNMLRLKRFSFVQLLSALFCAVMC